MRIEKKIKNVMAAMKDMEQKRNSLPNFFEEQTDASKQLRLLTEVQMRLCSEEYLKLTRDAAWLKILRTYLPDLSTPWERIREHVDTEEQVIKIEIKNNSSND